MPRLVAGRCTATRLTGYAIDFDRCGNQRLSRWCIDHAVELGARNEHAWNSVIDLCLEAGLHDTAASVAHAFYDRGGLLPYAVVRTIGRLIYHREHRLARELLDRLVEQHGERLLDLAPSPGLSRLDSPCRLRVMLAGAGDGMDPAVSEQLDLAVARLCFAFAAFDASTSLFERCASLDPEDAVAWRYASIRADGPDRCCDAAQAPRLPGRPEWQALRATTAFLEGDLQTTTAIVEEILGSKYPDHPELPRIIADARAMITAMAACGGGLRVDAGSAIRDGAEDEAECTADGLTKLFICGHGWSGSGAVYDALMEFDLFSEPETSTVDRHLNDDTESEYTFVQGPAGLGWLWRRANETHALRPADLWDLFRCHVLGAGAIGYAEYKSARMATALIERFGATYTGIFRRLYAELIEAHEGRGRLTDLRNILVRATEALSTMLHAGAEGNVVLLNNAVFGRNLDMLELFRDYKAIVVTRNPLDQYADRKSKDLKHWMTPGRFTSFYCESLEATRARIDALGEAGPARVKLVEFERFVLEQDYRQELIDWALDGRAAVRVRHRFDPSQSSRNIGIHEQALTTEERSFILSGTRSCRGPK